MGEKAQELKVGNATYPAHNLCACTVLFWVAVVPPLNVVLSFHDLFVRKRAGAGECDFRRLRMAMRKRPKLRDDKSMLHMTAHHPP